MKLLKSFSSFTLVNFLGAGVGFFVMPILTHYLSPKDYGILSLINLYISILIPFMSLNAFGLLYIDYFNKGNEEGFSQKFSSVFIFPFVNFFFFLISSLIFKSVIAKYLDIPLFVVPIIPIVALFVIYNEHLLQFLVITKSTVKYVLVNLFKIIVETSLTLIFIIYLGYNWEGRIYSWLIVIALIATYSYINFNNSKYLKLIKPDFVYIKKSLLYGLPLIIHVIGKMVVNQSDRLFISKMVSVEELGVYNVGYTIGNIISILSGAFLAVFTPYLFERLANIDYKKKIEIIRMSYVYIFILVIVLMVISVLSPVFFKYFIDVKYSNGIKYIFWICLSYVFWGGYILFTGYLQFLKETKIIAILAIINISLNFVLNYYFIKFYGSIGAAYATCISFFVIMIFSITISSIKYPMPWLNFRKILNVE